MIYKASQVKISVIITASRAVTINDFYSWLTSLRYCIKLVSLLVACIVAKILLLFGSSAHGSFYSVGD